MNFSHWHPAITEIAQRLQSSQQQMVCAESCTGGLLSAALTSMAGSSAWFAGAWVSYSNEFKMQHLRVPENTLQQNGAVSEATVAAMLSGAQQQSGQAVAVAISGIAGPGGATPGKPVGTVCIGWACGPARQCTSFYFEGDRDQVRYAAVETALEGLITQLKSASN